MTISNAAASPPTMRATRAWSSSPEASRAVSAGRIPIGCRLPRLRSRPALAARPPVRSGHEQDRPVRPGEDAARDRAEDEAAERRMAVGAHDDEVERVALGE